MKIFSFIVLCLVLASCASPYTNKMSYTQTERNKWQEKAENGNAEAQFMLGNSYCCGKDNFFSTEEAIKWWCKAANNGYDEAREKLNMYGEGKACKLKERYKIRTN